ncbi:MAG: twin-arginine translocase subunit TatC [Planctomycetota bacterium]
MTNALDKEKTPPEDEMSLIDHLMEMRRRFIISLASIFIGSLVAGLAAGELTQRLLAPLKDTDRLLRDARAESFDNETLAAVRTEIRRARVALRESKTMSDRTSIRDALAVELRWIGEARRGNYARRLRSEIRPPTPAEPFLLTLKLAVIGGLVLSSPVWILQLWGFVSPGLLRREKRIIARSLAVGVLLFFAGALFGYVYVLPPALDYLFRIANDMGMITEFDVGGYIGFVLMVLLGFGLAFETPLAVAALAALGIISHHTLLKYWRHAVLGAFILGAVLTPPDVLTQLMMASVLGAMYLVSILVAFILHRDRERQAILNASGTDSEIDRSARPTPESPAPSGSNTK